MQARKVQLSKIDLKAFEVILISSTTTNNDKIML